MADDDDEARSDQRSAVMSQDTPPTSFASINKQPAIVAAPPSPGLPSKSPQPGQPPAAEPAVKRTPLESVPMTATSSSSSAPTDQQANGAAETNGAAPYGTRSRNRTGSSRPNYAEDRDPELEYELPSNKKSRAAAASAMPNSVVSGDNDRSSGANTRRSSNAAPAGPVTAVKGANLIAPKDHLPGMSSFSVNPEGSPAPPAQSKKRKAPGSGPTGSQTSSTITQTPAAGPPRRQIATVASNMVRTTNLMTFENSQGYLKNGKLKADDGTLLGVDDQVYLICEPPGEPYYLARIMEFLHANNDHRQPVDSLRVNWYFRPRDIQRKVNDTRVVFASMQSDTSPITSLRGKCRVSHKNDIKDLDEYRKTKDSFWYEKMFDRYIHRYYEVIPTRQVINVPDEVKKVLDERWKFVVVEIGRGRDLTSEKKSCKSCDDFCASNDSVDCAVCQNTYHMKCVRPPLSKKPARGFGWSCAPCSRRQERKLEARNTPNVGEKAVEGEEEEFVDEEDDDHGTAAKPAKVKKSSDTKPPTAEQITHANLWPYRYLGIHCELKDALDYDDRIYPRASSRLGGKHQADVELWHGRPVRFVKPAEVKRRFIKGSGNHKKDGKQSKETNAAIEANRVSRETRPKWVVDEPLGYIPRGEDLPNSDLRNTAQLTFRLPQIGSLPSRGEDDSSTVLELDQREKFVDDYMARARELARPVLGVNDYSTNFLDKALELLTANNYEADKALAQLRTLRRRKDLKEPELTQEEIRRFEEGVSRYGSELRNISRHVGKGQKHGEIVRFYYMWKKTARGRQIWDNYEGRKGKKQAKQADSKLLDDVADDVDDSAFDNMKAAMRKRGFECKFCSTRHSPQWRRAPVTAPGTTVPADPTAKASKDKSAHLMLALCQRCAGLWRKYGIQWENIDEVAKKVAASGGRAWKRRIDEELLIELVSANQASSIGVSSTAAAAAASVGVDVPPDLTVQPGQENSKKRQKIGSEPQSALEVQTNMSVESSRKKAIEKPPESPIHVEEPHIRILPCAVCYEFEPLGDQHLRCRHCRLTVHRMCYGVAEDRDASKWICDMCANDALSQNSTHYECILCPVQSSTDTSEIYEPPKASHKKKSDREREKERLEKELVTNATNLYYRQQEEKGRPKEPRQPLKRTSGNNWVHIVCAIFQYSIKFDNPTMFLPAEGFGMIPRNMLAHKCKLCKTNKGACVKCPQCDSKFHVGCAQQFGYHLVFEITPVKPFKKDALKEYSMGGEHGFMDALIYCKEHAPKHKTHPMYEVDDDEPLNALQKFTRVMKGTDAGRPGGTIRRALLVQSASKTAAEGADPSTHRGSTSAQGSSGATGKMAAPPATTRSSRVSPSATAQSEEVDEGGDRVVCSNETPHTNHHAKECRVCGTDASPKWHDDRLKKLAESIASRAVQPRAAEPPVPENTPAARRGMELSEHRPDRGSAPPTDHNDGGNASSRDRPTKRAIPQLDGAEETHSAVHPPTTELEPKPGLEVEPETVNAVEQPPLYLCHKCYLRKLKQPAPPHVPTPQPETVPSDAQEQETTTTSPQRSLVWPSGHAPAATDAYRGRGWTHQPEPAPYHAPERLTNGISHSPPEATIPPVSHYAPPPPAHYNPPAYPYHAADIRDRAPAYHIHMPMQYHMQHHQVQVNGYSEPPSFQYRRDHTGQLVQIPYVPPALRGTPPHPSAASLPPSIRSPPVSHHMRSPPMQEPGPHGPPEAAENPFAIPYGSHSSPRPQYQGNAVYGSPAARNRERPETPDYGRDGRWPSERPLANGASESPSLRNLLH